MSTIPILYLNICFYTLANESVRYLSVLIKICKIFETLTAFYLYPYVSISLKLSLLLFSVSYLFNIFISTPIIHAVNVSKVSSNSSFTFVFIYV